MGGFAENATTTAYVAYLDESFDQFWSLSNPQGNFCYCVFALPDDQVSSLAELHNELLKDFQNAVKIICANRLPAN